MNDIGDLVKTLPNLATAEELAWLSEMSAHNGYFAPNPIGKHKWAAISQFAFTCGILTGEMFDDFGYENRWCYEGFGLALRALAEWRNRGFQGEPIGWHRHPDSGRRRPDGDPSKEYINH